MPKRVFPEGWFQAQQTAELESASGAGNPLLPRPLRPCSTSSFNLLRSRGCADGAARAMPVAWVEMRFRDCP